MTNYDEYQKFIRYKYGHHGFIAVLALVLMNYFFSLFYDFQWAESKELEIIVLITLVVIITAILNVYHGAYFTKKQSPILYVVLFVFTGLMNLYLSFSAYSPLIEEGLVTSNIVTVLSAILFLSLPLAYYARRVVDKRREDKDDDYA